MEMKRHGIMIGLDDFGTGYSNISTVINIPFGTIKLDKSLIWGSIGKPTLHLRSEIWLGLLRFGDDRYWKG